MLIRCIHACIIDQALMAAMPMSMHAAPLGTAARNRMCVKATGASATGGFTRTSCIRQRRHHTATCRRAVRDVSSVLQQVSPCGCPPPPPGSAPTSCFRNPCTCRKQRDVTKRGDCRLQRWEKTLCSRTPTRRPPSGRSRTGWLGTHRSAPPRQRLQRSRGECLDPQMADVLSAYSSEQGASAVRTMGQGSL